MFGGKCWIAQQTCAMRLHADVSNITRCAELSAFRAAPLQAKWINCGERFGDHILYENPENCLKMLDKTEIY